MNKILILIAILVSVNFAAQAQTEKGDQTLGVNAAFSYGTSNNLYINNFNNTSTSTSNNYKNTSYGLGPIYSYFIADKLDFGASLNYSSNLQKAVSSISNDNANDNGGYPLKQLNRSYGGELFIRKYFLYNNKIGFRTGARVSYTRGTNSISYAGTNAANNINGTSNNYDAGLNLDLVYYPAKQLGVAVAIANVEYNHYKQDNGDQGNNSGGNVTFNFVNSGLQLSVFYVFGNK